MKQEEQIFYLNSFSPWSPHELLSKLKEVLGHHDIDITKLDACDPPRQKCPLAPLDLDKITLWPPSHVSKWIFARTNVKCMSVLTAVLYRREVVEQGRGINQIYFSLKCNDVQNWTSLLTTLCVNFGAAHAYMDCRSRINHRLHQVRNDGSIEKNSISLLQGLPGLFRWNYFGSVYHDWLNLRALPPEIQRRVEGGIVLQSRNNLANSYDQEEVSWIQMMGKDKFHLPEKSDACCVAPTLDLFIKQSKD